MIYYMSGLLPYLGSKTYYFQWAISPLVPWWLTHFVRTGLIYLMTANVRRSSSEVEARVEALLPLRCSHHTNEVLQETNDSKWQQVMHGEDSDILCHFPYRRSEIKPCISILGENDFFFFFKTLHVNLQR